MAVCGHQFHGGDESDWILSTSAGGLDESTTAGRILKELFKKHCRNAPIKSPRKRPITMPGSPESVSPPKVETSSRPQPQPTQRRRRSKEGNENLIVKKLTGSCGFDDDFDESQHLNGCPMKWLYNKRLMEKNKTLRVGRLCSKKVVRKEEVKKERSKNLRDKTPIEVKVHKINLIEKYTTNCDEFLNPYMTVPKSTRDLETHRKKLAAKLNWKLHDESQDDLSLETSSELSSRHNYLPPRPLLGLKPLLSVLLAPHQETNCCSLAALQNSSPRNSKMEASLTIQSLDLPLSPPDVKPRPRTTNTLRWGSKSSLHAKKLQIPNPITINLEEKSKKLLPSSATSIKVIYNVPAKRFGDRTKQTTKSLSSLYYELKGKTNVRHQREKYFEEMIRDLTMEEREFKISRFLNMGLSRNWDSAQVWRNPAEKRKKLIETALAECESNLVCEKVRFSEKKSSRGLKEEENEREQR